MVSGQSKVEKRVNKPQSGDMIERDTLSQKVYSVLRERILIGKLKQGERIGEVAMSKELGVSATPVREALRMLRGDNLIEYEGRRGASVICPTIAEIKQCYDVRLALETLALREADANFTEADRDHFVALAEDSIQLASSHVEFTDRDRAFHAFFIEKAANSWVINFHNAIIDFLVVVRLPNMKQERVAAAGMEHLVIANSIRDRDLPKALATLEMQILRSRHWAIAKASELSDCTPDELRTQNET